MGQEEASCATPNKEKEFQQRRYSMYKIPPCSHLTHSMYLQVAVLDPSSSTEFKLAQILDVDDVEQTVSVHYLWQGRNGNWALHERHNKESRPEKLCLCDILYGPFLLREDGHLTKQIQQIIRERVKEEQMLTHKLPISK